MAETDWTRAIERIMPTPGAEDVLRMRTGVVDEVNSDGTVDVEVSGLVIPGLPVVDGVSVEAADTVMLISFRGSLIVLGRARTALPPNSTPVGTILEYAGATAPPGFLMADGASYLRADYPALFAVIGTTYGAADGTHFNVPNRKGRVGVGRDAAQSEFNTLGETGGAKTHTLTVAEMPAHNHGGATGSGTVGGGSNNFSINDGTSGSGFMKAGSSTGGRYAQIIQDSSHTHTIASQGGGGAHNNLQPYIALNYIIKT